MNIESAKVNFMLREELEVVTNRIGHSPREFVGNSSGEYTASELRRFLQELFPHRRLVLSQFTFYNQIGVAKPTGQTFKRRRRCYQMLDILPIACVLSLKEQGIPLKNIAEVPKLVQERASTIFDKGPGCRLSGAGEVVFLHIPGEADCSPALDYMLSGECDTLFWAFDVGELAVQLQNVATRLANGSHTTDVAQAA